MRTELSEAWLRLRAQAQDTVRREIQQAETKVDDLAVWAHAIESKLQNVESSATRSTAEAKGRQKDRAEPHALARGCRPRRGGQLDAEGLREGDV